MSGLVPDLLTTGYRTASDVYHAVLLRALAKNLTPQAGAALGVVDRRAEDLAWLLSIPTRRLVGESTPFVWLNVHRLARSTKHEDHMAVFVRHLLMTAFDAYFHEMPDGTAVRLKATPHSEAILLPRLGVQVATGCRDSILTRRSPTTFTVDTPERCQDIDLQTLDSDSRLRASPIPSSPSSRFLSARDLALFDAQYIEQITTDDSDSDRFPQIVSSALSLIATVDAELEARISSIIKWYVAIRSTNPQVHCSFTSSQLKGVVFLSYADNDLLLAEAIVHEFGHTELNTLMDTEALSREDADERFYSPWRTDPRPLSGLIHALYVFAGVVEFLGHAVAKPHMARHDAFLQARRTAICHRMRIGLMQIPQEKLTSLGREIIEDIGHRLRLQAYDMGTSAERVPDYIHDHLQAWKTEHPEFQSIVRLP